MPCYSRVTSTIEFGDKTDQRLLAEALKSLGYNVIAAKNGAPLRFYGGLADGEFANGKLTVRQDGSFDENAVKRAYSAQVVKSAAQRFGWTVKQPAENQFQVTRRI